MMKLLRPLSLSMLIIAWCLPPGGAHAQTTGTCTTSLASLDGWYGMLVAGIDVANGTVPESAKYLAGALLFDGNGNVSAKHVYAGSNGASSAAGTYSINTDCTITILLSVGTGSALQFDVALENSGEAVGIEVDSTSVSVATIDLQPQFALPTAGLNFTTTSLGGTFATACIGPLAAASYVTLATYAGGILVGSGGYNLGGTAASGSPLTGGSYSVNTDGTFTGSVALGGTTLDFFGVIASSGAEVEYFYTNVTANAPTAAFAACVGRQ